MLSLSVSREEAAWYSLCRGGIPAIEGLFRSHSEERYAVEGGEVVRRPWAAEEEFLGGLLLKATKGVTEALRVRPSNEELERENRRVAA